MVYYTSKDTMLFQNPTVADFTTTDNGYVDVYTWMTHFCSSKRLKFTAAQHSLVVKILVSNDGGATFEDPTFTNTYTVVPGTPVETNIDDFYSALKIQVKPASDNQPGILSTYISGSSISNASASGGGSVGQATMAASSPVVIASNQSPVTVAGTTSGGTALPLRVDASGQLITVGGGGGGGDASAANQQTQITAEQAILAKIIAAPATEAKQDTTKTSIDAITTKLSSDPSTGTKQSTMITLLGGTVPTYLGKYRTTTTAASESITVPVNSKTAQFYAAKNSEAYIEINATATATSPIYCNELILINLNLTGVTTLKIWVTTGNVGVIFYG